MPGGATGSAEGTVVGAGAGAAAGVLRPLAGAEGNGGAAGSSDSW
jgi:hypothetical protein